MKISVILGTIVVVAGAAAIAYKIGKEKVLKATKKVKCLDLSCVRDWIASNDMENYTSSYTVCLMRKNEIPERYYKRLKYFLDMDKCAYICLYDKNSKKVVKGQILLFESVSSEFASDLFIELPIED